MTRPEFVWHEKWFGKNEASQVIARWLKKNLDKVDNFDQITGALPMGEKKQVRLVVGEGDNKIEIGTAEIEIMPNGTRLVDLIIDNPDIVEAFGGQANLRGVMLPPNVPYGDDNG